MTKVRVLSIPAGHRYVEHLTRPEDDDGVRRLADPPVPGGGPGVWWPPAAVDPGWVRAHADEFDLVHLHFGFESFALARLQDWTATLAALRRPLVFTVHDLSNPHLVDQGRYREQLDVLVRAADAVLTLTPGAARVIRDRWGIPVHVVPHPHLAPLQAIGGARHRPAGPLRVGVHLKSLRAHIDAVPVLSALEQAARTRDLRGKVELVVHAHREIRDRAFPRHDATVVAAVEDLARRGAATVHWVERLDDAELLDYLRSLDVSVLPYAWGTHSGWLEECRDVGTAVLAPDVGHFAEQGDVATYRRSDDGPDVASLVQALLQLSDRPATTMTGRRRLAQRRQVAHAHRQIYRKVLAAVEAR